MDFRERLARVDGKPGEDFKEIMQWARKWHLKLSIVKIEFCVFSLDNRMLEKARKYQFVIEGQTVKYNPKAKILGVKLDERLRFESHIELVERKALRSLDSLRKVKETEIIRTNSMLQLSRTIRLSNDICDWLSFCRSSNSEKSETIAKWHLSSVEALPSARFWKSENGFISWTEWNILIDFCVNIDIIKN